MMAVSVKLNKKQYNNSLACYRVVIVSVPAASGDMPLLMLDIIEVAVL